MKCDSCLINPACKKNYYDRSLCSEALNEIVEKITRLRKTANSLEKFYGLELYFFERAEKNEKPKNCNKTIKGLF